MAKIVFILVIYVVSFCAEGKKDTATLMKLIENEEEALLAIPVEKRWPKLYWNLMLLNMEKFRVVRSQENEMLLAESPDVVAEKGRRYYFERSNILYEKIKKLGEFMVEKWPDSEYNDEIYYSLAVMTMNQNNKYEVKIWWNIILRNVLNIPPRGQTFTEKLSLKWLSIITI